MYVPNSYWGEIVLNIVYLINLVSTQFLGNVSRVQFMLSSFSFVTMLQNLESRVFVCFLFVCVQRS